MSEKTIYTVYGEHCFLYNEEDDSQLHGDRFYINQEIVSYDENGDVEDSEIVEGFVGEVQELFLGEDGSALLLEDYPGDSWTEFTNGLWSEDEFETLEEAEAYILKMRDDALEESSSETEKLAEELESKFTREEIIEGFDRIIADLQKQQW